LALALVLVALGTVRFLEVLLLLVAVRAVLKIVMLLLQTVVLVVLVVVHARVLSVSQARVVLEQQIKAMQEKAVVVVAVVVVLVELALRVALAFLRVLRVAQPQGRLVALVMGQVVEVVQEQRTLETVDKEMDPTRGAVLAVQASLFCATQIAKRTSPRLGLDSPTRRPLRVATRFTRLPLELVRLPSDYGSLRFP